MQQTILAALALMLVGSYTLSQHGSAARTYNELVDDELEIAASGVATHVLEIISNRSFDERTLPDRINVLGMLGDATELTVSSLFGKISGCDLDEPFKDLAPCLDVDDAAMPEGDWQNVPFRLKDGHELPFDVHVDVFYVDPSDLDTPLPDGQTSLHKKVVVKVRADRHVKQNRYKDGFVRLERIFSYDVKRAKNRFREEFGNPIENILDDVPLIDDLPLLDDVLGDGGVDDADQPVWICHRSVIDGEITWSSRTAQQRFVEQHIGHGDSLGKCSG
jgi:hypothetical protein